MEAGDDALPDKLLLSCRLSEAGDKFKFFRAVGGVPILTGGGIPGRGGGGVRGVRGDGGAEFLIIAGLLRGSGE